MKILPDFIDIIHEWESKKKLTLEEFWLVVDHFRVFKTRREWFMYYSNTLKTPFKNLYALFIVCVCDESPLFLFDTLLLTYVKFKS